MELASNDHLEIVGGPGESCLTIKGLVPGDAGQYVCSAENSNGKVESSAALKVKGTIVAYYLHCMF